MKEVFRLLDDDGDGLVETAKLRRIVPPLQPTIPYEQVHCSHPRTINYMYAFMSIV
jgi:Ca2+-binding EF-hand superfamily protein